jgi:hypothetical protein
MLPKGEKHAAELVEAKCEMLRPRAPILRLKQ